MLSSKKQALRSPLMLLIFVAPVGCGMKKIAPPPPAPDAYQGIVGSDNDRLQESLFKGDQAVLSNQDIERILGAHLTLSDRHRLAVLRLDPRFSWSEELAELEKQNSERFLQVFRSGTQFTQVRFMPPLLIPEKRTVPYLREAAARFQADLLLVYTTRVQNFQRFRVIHANEVKAQCIVDSVLLDVRTGIVVHSAQFAETITAKKEEGDLNFSETVAKAETHAMGRAMLEVADAVVAYLREPDN